MDEILYFSDASDYKKISQKFYYINDFDKNNFLTVGYAGITYPQKNYFYQYYCLPNYVFEYVTQGTVCIESKGRLYKAHTGDVYVLRRKIPARYYGENGQKISKIFFNAHGKLIDKLFEAFDLTDDITVVHINIENEIKQIHSMLTNNTNSSAVTQELSMLIFEIIMKISIVKNKDNYIFTPSNSIIHMIKNQIDCGKFLSIKDTAERFNITDKYIIKEFKKEYGLTPYAYLTQKRTEVAMRLLKTSDLTIKEISNELLFTDNNYFSKAFKKQTGMSPTEYRKANQKQP